MTKSDEDFEVWCVLYGKEIVRYGTGPRKNKFSTIYGMYRTEEEARAGAAEIASKPRPVLWVPTPSLSKTPIAWLVTFIILSHESGDAKYHVESCYGGQIDWNDDRDVMAIFPTLALAKEFVASKGFPDA